MTSRLHPVPQVFGKHDTRPISHLESDPSGYGDEIQHRTAYTKAFCQCLQRGYNESDAVAFARGYAAAHDEYGYANVVETVPLVTTAAVRVRSSDRRSVPE